MAHRLGLGREALSQFERGVRIVNVAGRCAVRCRRGGRAGHVGLDDDAHPGLAAAV